MSKKIIIPIIAFLILIPMMYFYYDYALNLVNSLDEAPVSFTVEQGQSVEEIAGTLEREGLIRSAALFQLYTALSNLPSKLQAGEYQIPQNLNVRQIAELLQHGTFEEKLTFIEGWRREEYAEAISSKLTGAEFLRETEGLEGYLFPDTYFVSKETTAEDLVKMMRENFEAKISQLELAELTLEEVVNIASIVEREVSGAEDKPIVAGILIKRFLNGWALQADATIQYALGFQSDPPEADGGESASGRWWKKNLTEDDLEVNSPYNTYANPGLPPAPICNPGLGSLRAVLEPEETGYWYYLSDNEGKMHFAETNEEHNQNVAKYVW